MNDAEVVLDSCVVIDYLRERPEADEFIESLASRPVLPTIVTAEVFAGIRDGRERTLFSGLLANSRVIELTHRIAEAGGLLQRQYRPSHNVGLGDALIAATAIELKARLVTCNVKHFPMLTDVIKPY